MRSPQSRPTARKGAAAIAADWSGPDCERGVERERHYRGDRYYGNSF